MHITSPTVMEISGGITWGHDMMEFAPLPKYFLFLKFPRKINLNALKLSQIGQFEHTNGKFLHSLSTFANVFPQIF